MKKAILDGLFYVKRYKLMFAKETLSFRFFLEPKFVTTSFFPKTSVGKMNEKIPIDYLKFSFAHL